MSTETFVMDPLHYDINDIIFEKSIVSTAEYSYTVIKIKTKTPDGKQGKLIFKLDRCYSSGIANADINKPALPIQLYDTQGHPSERQIKTEELLNKIVAHAKLYLAANDIKLPDIDRLSPVYYYSKQETALYQKNLAYVHKYILYENNINYPSCSMLMNHQLHKLFKCNGLSSLELYTNDYHNKIHDKVTAIMNNSMSYIREPYRSPVLNVNIKTSNNKISTLFISEDTDTEVDPVYYTDKPSFVTCAISIDSINIGKYTNGIKIRLEECIIKEIITSKRRLLK
jgi:hypothetical protein